MKVENLKKLINDKLTIQEISNRTGRAPTTIRYWLRKYKLTTFRKRHGKIPDHSELPHKCPCGETDPSKFYGNKKRICCKCHGKYTLKLGQKKKDRARKVLGDKCQECGYSKYKCSLDIHHLDPSSKDPNFASMRGWNWERIEREIQACVLLCKNCHTAVHTGELKI